MKFLAAAILCHAGATLLAGTAQAEQPVPISESIGQAFSYLGLMALAVLIVRDLTKTSAPTDDKSK